MSQEWISDKDRRWQMRCNTRGCKTTAEPTATRQDLEEFRAAGWFIAKVFGDACPACVRAGKVPPGTEPRTPDPVCEQVLA